jgi:hypothetical protein
VSKTGSIRVRKYSVEARVGWRKRGSMLSVTALVGGILLFTCVVGFAGYMLLAQQKRGQTDSDEVALNVAKLMNGDDRVGQMNNVVERCRELVYVSRTNLNKANNMSSPLFQPLAQQLLDESRANSAIVENERANQLNLTTLRVKNFINQHNESTRTGSRLTLPFFQTQFPVIQEADFGAIAGVQCNVLNLQVIPELKDYDMSQHYIQPGSNLYMGNINAKLPAPDSDLNFMLASLPANVGGSVAPVRLANPEVFIQTAPVMKRNQQTHTRPTHLPAAIQLIENMDVAGGSNQGTIRLSATATADGGLPPP